MLLEVGILPVRVRMRLTGMASRSASGSIPRQQRSTWLRSPNVTQEGFGRQVLANGSADSWSQTAYSFRLGNAQGVAFGS